MPAHTESYESFDEVTGVVQDLAAVAHRRRESQRVRVTAEDADVDVAFVIDAPPAVVWQYFVQPDKRARHAFETGESSVVFSPNDEGRLAETGATSHCGTRSGGDALREHLDWRPYEYFTCRLTPLPAELVILSPMIETWSLRGSQRKPNRVTVDSALHRSVGRGDGQVRDDRRDRPGKGQSAGVRRPQSERRSPRTWPPSPWTNPSASALSNHASSGVTDDRCRVSRTPLSTVSGTALIDSSSGNPGTGEIRRAALRPKPGARESP